MGLEATPKISVLPTGGYVSTLFVYNTVAYQSAANSAYLAKSTADAVYASNPNTANNRTNFKSYDEKIKYLIGKTAVASCSK
jgi:hypothetical protein